MSSDFSDRLTSGFLGVHDDEAVQHPPFFSVYRQLSSRDIPLQTRLGSASPQRAINSPVKRTQTGRAPRDETWRVSGVDLRYVCMLCLLLTEYSNTYVKNCTVFYARHRCYVKNVN